VPLYTITWIARFAVFIVPVLAYVITKRICLGLQRKDLHLLEHGVETGIIRQLPSGEFIEETRPLSEDEVAAIDRSAPLALAPGEESAEAEEDVPAPGMRGSLGKVKARLNKLVNESVPMDGHANGHEPNGHGTNGHAVSAGEEHAAIGAGTDGTSESKES
jgi:ubiquinol-cytochrome c reductase cytochrome b subunit